MFFKKDKNENNDFSKVAALLIHAAKIDENFSKSEEKIIKQALLQIGVNSENLEEIFLEGKKIEENSNQILEFDNFSKIAALLIHAAKIDENFPKCLNYFYFIIFIHVFYFFCKIQNLI